MEGLLKDIDDKVNKVSTLAKFSHELKTPLHGILNIADLMKENWDNIDEAQKINALESIIDAGKNMSVIVNFMLNNSQNKEDIKFHFLKVEIIDELRRVAQQFAQLYAGIKNVDIYFTTNLECCYVKGDKFWLGQVIINLLSNAYNYTQEGKIEMLIEEARIQEKQYCMITVKDQGEGISPDNLSKIFKPFNKDKNQKDSSTGLGLNICYEVIEAHGGTIKAYNNESKGASIEIKLPI
ncbi:MAG: hypothetical protein DGJ47_001098 [Rickettsiaceae bacterium]